MYDINIKSVNFDKEEKIIFHAVGIEGFYLHYILEKIQINPAYKIEIINTSDPAEGINKKETPEDEALKAAENLSAFCKGINCSRCVFRDGEKRHCILCSCLPAGWDLKEGEENE